MMILATKQMRDEHPMYMTKIYRTLRYAAACLMLALYMIHPVVWAEDVTIESITANQQGANVVVKIKLNKSIPKSPTSFSISNPARIALDFIGVTIGDRKSSQVIGLGDVRNVHLIQVSNRTRLVFNLNRPLGYSTVVEGDSLILTFDSSGKSATEKGVVSASLSADNKSSAGADPKGVSSGKSATEKDVVSALLNVNNKSPIPADPKAVNSDQIREKRALREVDFRRGNMGEGRIVIELPQEQVVPDVRQQGQKIEIHFPGATLPEILRRRLDVTDFDTPVTAVTTLQRANGVHMTIDTRGLWEQSAYQSDTQMVIDVKPIKEDQNKLTQGTQGYRGEKLSLNFQNIEVRALLQVIADFTGLNIITSDTVNGTLTLRLKDVPWDQALDIIMQSKGLDMRKNGSVIWIAPKDELLTKEKLELEQKAQIAELEPLRNEIFQLNYQKAESFKMVFGLDGSSDNKNRILSKRGSAVIDPRTNQLFVTDIQSKLDDVRKLLQKTDVATRQVLIEARIVEADDKFGRNLGAKLGFVDLRSQRGGVPGYGVGGGTSRLALSGNLTGAGQATGQLAGGDTTFSNSNFVNLPASGLNGYEPGNFSISLFSAAANRFLNLELSALELDSKGKIISSPRVITADQQQAIVEQGEEIPYQQATSSGATAVQFKRANLRLEVTPQITPDGNIILTVDVSKDSRGDITPGGVAINTKHVKTNVQVENGGTVVLGGIFTMDERTTTSKVPLLGDIPVVGHLFKSTARQNNKTELLIFITPKIILDNPVSSR